MKLKLLLFVSGAGASAVSALWTFPSIVAAAFLVAWGAEAAQLLIPQGLALAILAWLQTLPELAVEAVIAWEAGRDAARAHLAIANLTGAIRLLLGLGWPMVYAVFAVAGRTGAGGRPPRIRLERAHAVEIMGLAPPLVYFVVILLKQRFTWTDAMILVALYGAYLWAVTRGPSHPGERLADLPAVARWAHRQRGWRRPAAVAALFGGGGLLLAGTTHAFLESMLAVAGLLGVSQFVFVQWVAPFLSEFPEKVSAFSWAARRHTAPMALANLISSTINQWTVLAAVIPLIYGVSTSAHGGVWLAFRFDDAQRLEILLTLLQTALGVLLLARMEFGALDAGLLFLLWVAQFLAPGLRREVTLAYGAWILLLAGQFAAGRRALVAPREVWELLRSARGAARSPRA